MPHKSLIKSRYSSGGNFTRGNTTISHKIWLENYSSEILLKYPRDQLDNYTVILFQYGRFPECMIIMYWRRLCVLWQLECIYVYFLGHCSILPVLMDFHTSIKIIYCIILIFVIFSHNELSMGFSSALKRNWKGINKKELELELIKRNWNWLGIAIFDLKGIGIGIERKGIGIGIELKKRNWPQPCMNVNWIKNTFAK